MKRILFISIISGVLLSPGFVRGEVADRIVAIVNDKVITLRQLKTAEYSVLQNRPRNSGNQAAPLIDRTKLLEDLIEDRLLTQTAESAGIAVGEDELSAAIEEVKRRNRILDDEKFKETVLSEGQTWEQFLEEIRKQLKVVKLVNREVRSRVSVDEGEIQDYYQKNKSSFEASREKVRARHILFSVPDWASDQMDQDTRKKAEEVLAQIKNGMNFIEAAKQYSEDASKDQGGDLGVLSKGQMITPLDEVIFNLKPGEVSQPIRSSLGYHLVKVEEKMGGEETASEAVKEQIRNLLFQKKVESLYREWMTKLRSEAYIEVKEGVKP
jgi:peptidyl-prolyl cis-trans isomerase SurA